MVFKKRVIKMGNKKVSFQLVDGAVYLFVMEKGSEDLMIHPNRIAHIVSQMSEEVIKEILSRYIAMLEESADYELSKVKKLREGLDG